MIMKDSIEKNYVIPSFRTRKYEKFLVTIALRLGIEIKEPEDIKLNFKGSFSEHNNKLIYSNPSTNPQRHDSYNYLGSLTVNGQAYTETEVKICTPRQDQNQIKTLWPVFKDSYRSQIFNHTKTRDFIDEYGSDRINLTISDLAQYYHPLFLENPDRTPISMSVEVSEIKASIRRKMHKTEKDELEAKHAKEIKKIEARLKKELKEQKKEYKKHIDQVIKENEASQGSPNQETIKAISDVDWSSSAITSAVFNYYEVIGDYLCIYINEQEKPIRLKNSSWTTKYPVALKNAQKLKKGDIFKYITQGVNKFSSEEWFNRIILEESDSNEIEAIEQTNLFDSKDSIAFENDDLFGTNYILTHQIISDLNNTKYTFKKTFNVINTYLIPGEEFRKHYGFSWSRPMILIETDLGWYIDSASNSNGNTKWTPGEHQNCRISLTKGKQLPYWLEK